MTLNLKDLPEVKPPFSFPVKVGHVSSNPISIELEADANERQALAELWNLPTVNSFKAAVKIARWKRDGLRVSGSFEGELTQNCVVSLQPISTKIEDEFVTYFVPETSKLARQSDLQNGELVIDVDGPDIPDTYSSNVLDVAEVVSEFAAMSIDPYPRDLDAEIDDKYQQNLDENEKSPSPFAALEAIKGDLK